MKKESQTSRVDSKQSPSQTIAQRNRVEELAEEYASLKRAGESVSIEQYIEKYPELAGEIRELFPMMEILDRAVGSRPTARTTQLSGEIGSGTRLGEYQLIKPIGRGGMGVVYQATHVVLGSSVAVKLLPAGLDRPKLRERFQREASAAARMRHPNIVRVFDYGLHGETLYYVMELVEGCGLNQIIDPVQATEKPSGTALPSVKVETKATKTIRDLEATQAFDDPKSANGFVDETDFDLKTSASDSHIDRSKFKSTGSGYDSLWRWVARIGVQAADALDYAHSAGVIHRDIKPGNLMIDADEKIHVMDFGLAKVADDHSLTATGDVLGTLRYMPPESFTGRADHRSDIYSLGLTLYELLANRPAFKDVDRGKLIQTITIGQIKRLRKTLPKIPADLETVVHKAIQVDPKDRYASAAEFRDDLKNFLTGQPVKARRTTWVYRSFRWVSRNKIVASLAASVFVLLTVAVIAFAISADRLENLANEKETERAFASISAQNAKAQTRQALRNLLAAKLSDASGWSTSQRPGHRVEGMRAVREAIELSRSLGVFDQYEDQIKTIAVTLSTLPDIPVEQSWIHPVKMVIDAPVGFNGDLTMYATYNYREKPNVCRVYKSADSEPELIETIPVDGTFDHNTLRFSDDNRYLIGHLWIENKTWLWIYDRKKKTSIQHQARSHEYTTPIILNRSGRILFLTKDFRILVVDIQTGQTVSEYKLPGGFQENTEGYHVEVTADETRLALVADLGNRICLLNLVDATFETIRPGNEQIFAIGWRPDGQQLAIGGDERIRIWDLPRHKICASFETECDHVTELLYSGDGRLLFTSGWDWTTRIYDPLAQKQVIRCEAFVKKISSDGTRFVTHTGRRYTIRNILSSQVIREYKYNTSSRSPSVGIDAQSATLWFSPEYTSSVVDFSGNRYLVSKRGGALEMHTAMDPLGRDVFVSDGNRLKQYPIHVERGDSKVESDGTIESLRIGPPRILKWKSNPNARSVNNHHIGFDASGEKLSVNRDLKCQIVLSRESNWTSISHTHAERRPIKVAIHPSLPLIATSVHHGDLMEVRDTEKNEVVFSLPTKHQETKFTPDGKLLIVADEGNLTTYEVGTWNPVATFDDDVRIQTRYYAVSPDSHWIAAETSQPRGVTFVDAKTLRPALWLIGNHTRPESYIHAIDSTGRFLSANRGKSIIGVWDLYELRRHFESLDLEWPLDGLGNPTPMRDPNVPVNVIWESVQPIEPEVTTFERVTTGQWGTDWFLTSDPGTQQYERAVVLSWKRFSRKMSSLFGGLSRTFQRQWHPARSQQQVLAMINAAIDQGAKAYDSGDPGKCSEIYFRLLTKLRSQKIENSDGELTTLIINTIETAEQSENDASRNGQAWVLRRGIDSIVERLISAKMESVEQGE